MWSGELSIDTDDPVQYLSLIQIRRCIPKQLSVDSFIMELQDLSNGDIIAFSNGNERLEVEVKNVTTEASYPVSNATTRPIIHVPIDIVNPNKRLLYSKGLDSGAQETIQFELYNNNIQFQIART